MTRFNCEIKSRNSYWDNVRFFTILSVVIFHFLLELIDSNPNKLAQGIYLFVYSFHMHTFLFIAGLFMKSDKTAKLRIDKVIYYMLLAYILKFALYLVEAIAGGEPSWQWFSTSNIPWYLIVSAEYLVFVYLIRNISPKIVFPLSVIAALAAGYFSIIGDFLCVSKFIVYFPFFYFGYCLTPQKAEKFIKSKWVRIISIIFFICFGIISLLFTDKVFVLRNFFSSRLSYAACGFPATGILLRLLSYLISAVMVVGWCALISKKQLTFFSSAGSRTLPVYFLHYFFARLIMAMDLGKLFIDKMSDFGIIILAVFGFAVTCLLSLPLFNYPFIFIKNMLTKACIKIGIIKSRG